ncbi:hypothetical protein COLO4_24604 [Corchorus olitorius]|uniref:Uncharacterized protein n=1 Tax=Corchorus olitorius TaxID=93759 RepID=A0A1R3I8V5_9ROSI|nr:hypothetical protein COLO4_24604 [Corchorus olitorius]
MSVALYVALEFMASVPVFILSQMVTPESKFDLNLSQKSVAVV